MVFHEQKVASKLAKSVLISYPYIIVYMVYTYTYNCS